MTLVLKCGECYKEDDDVIQEIGLSYPICKECLIVEDISSNDDEKVYKISNDTKEDSSDSDLSNVIDINDYDDNDDTDDSDDTQKIKVNKIKRYRK